MSLPSSYSDAACESLVKAVAQDDAPFTLPLTETQQALGITAPLVFVFHLATRSGSLSNEASGDRFQQLQKIYQQYQKSELDVKRSYLASPSLMPSPEAQIVIREMVAKKMEILEKQAAQVAEELLQSNAGMNTSTSRSTNGDTKARNSRPKYSKKKAPRTQRSPVVLQQEEKPRKDTETLDQVLMAIQQVIPYNEADEDASLWVEVKNRNKTRQVEEQRNEKLPVDENSNDNPNHSEDIPKNQRASGNDESTVTEPPVIVRDVSNRPCPPCIDCATRSTDGSDDELVELSPAETSSSGETTLAEEDIIPTDNSPPSGATHGDISYTAEAVHCGPAEQLEERIRHLEEELAKKDRLLQETNKAHKRVLHSTKESCDERIQALQLRLYISETKLKTFQDALEDHVQAVENNVVSTNTQGGSPLFRRKGSSQL